MSTDQTTSSTTQAPAPPNFLAVLREMLRASEKVSDLIFSLGKAPQIELSGKIEKVESKGKSLIDAMEHGDQDGCRHLIV